MNKHTATTKYFKTNRQYYYTQPYDKMCVWKTSNSNVANIKYQLIIMEFWVIFYLSLI